MRKYVVGALMFLTLSLLMGADSTCFFSGTGTGSGGATASGGANGEVTVMKLLTGG